MGAKSASPTHKGTPENLRTHPKGSKYKSSSKRLSLFELRAFCLAYVRHKSIKASCEHLGINMAKGVRLSKDPRFQEELEKVAEKFIEKATTVAAEEFVLELSQVDREMFGILKSPPHPDRGFIDNIESGHILYKRLKAIENPNTVIHNSSTAIAPSVSVQPGAAASQLPHLFDPPWRKALREAQTVESVNIPAAIEGEVK